MSNFNNNNAMNNNTSFNANNVANYSDNFSEEGFWNKIKRSLKKCGENVIRLALILYYELEDPSISMAQKSMIIGALGYFILPFDIIADYIPVVGFADDLAALTAAYNFIKNNISPEIEQKAEKKLKEWFA